MKKIVVNTGLSISLFMSFSVFANKTHTIKGQEFVQKSIHFREGDTIKFIQNISHFGKDKPTAIYFNGSLPNPLLYKWDDGYIGMPPFTYFNFESFLQEFNLILVSKPFTPVFMEMKNTANSLYVPDTTRPNCLDTNFLRCNNLDYLGERGSFLIDYLINTQSISFDKVLLIGHSQGGLEAARVAKINSKVSHLVMISSSPFGRIQHMATSNFLSYIRKEISLETYKSNQALYFETLRSAVLKPKPISCENGDSDENLVSFSSHSLEDILASSADVLYIAGTLDISSLYVDQLILDAVVRRKFNVQTILLENTDHSLFVADNSGVINYQLDKWQYVFDEILKWSFSH